MGEVRYRNLVDGEGRDAIGGGTIDSVDPSTGAVWATIPRGTRVPQAARVAS